jgi:hypothetical protein
VLCRVIGKRKTPPQGRFLYLQPGARTRRFSCSPWYHLLFNSAGQFWTSVSACVLPSLGVTAMNR